MSVVERVEDPEVALEEDSKSVNRLSQALHFTQQLSQPIVGRVRISASYVHRSGFIVLGSGIVCIIIGEKFSWAEFLFLGLACIGTLLVAAAFLLGSTQLKVEIELKPKRAVVGERVAGSITVANNSNRRLLPLRVELNVGNRKVAFDLPMLQPSASVEEVIVVSTTRRGVINVGPVKSVRSDPLGLLRREMTWVEPVEIFVHPKTTSISSIGAGILRDLEGQESTQLSVSDIAFHTLREYIPGDDRRFIHWKTSARTGKLMIRQFVDTRRSQVGIALGGTDSDFAGEDEYELGVSVFGSLSRRAMSDSQSLCCAANGRMLPTASPTLLLDSLSRLNFPLTVGNLHDSVHEMSKVAKNLSLGVLVFGSSFDAISARKLGRRFGAGTTLLAIRVGADRNKFSTIGDLTLLELEKLGDLSPLLRAGL
ncbi:MAG: DUF58 domain-containing protein [Acidimicrobiales bacterium]|nr:DUF58 domain-containing protein [Acidimicrobiales bacterium]